MFININGSSCVLDEVPEGARLIALVESPLQPCDLAYPEFQLLSGENYHFAIDPDPAEEFKRRVNDTRVIRMHWVEGGLFTAGSCRLSGSSAVFAYYPRTRRTYFFVHTIPLA